MCEEEKPYVPNENTVYLSVALWRAINQATPSPVDTVRWKDENGFEHCALASERAA